MSKKLKVWEHPNCPSGELERIFKTAEEFRSAEQAPAVRVDHFLLALVLEGYPPRANDVLKVYKRVRSRWLKEI